MKGLQLLATGGALPGRVVTNEDLSRQVDTSDEWITTRTGIRQRYYCTESEDAATLAIAAARQALERSGLAASEIACCVAATLSAPTATPSVACRVQAALGLPENRPAFDVNAACSGFIYAIAAAHGLLNTLGGRYALVIGCEALSRMVDPTDRTTCVLFGDGAGAAILELAEDVPFAVTLGARGSEAIRVGGIGALCGKAHFHQQLPGVLVIQRTVRKRVFFFQPLNADGGQLFFIMNLHGVHTLFYHFPARGPAGLTA